MTRHKTTVHITIPKTTLVDKCDVCAVVATDSSDFLEHKKVHDEMILEGGETFPCVLCVLDFSSKKLLDAHRRRKEHIDKENPVAAAAEAASFHCALCVLDFSSKKLLDAHRRRKEHKDKKDPVAAAVTAVAKEAEKAAKKELSEIKKAKRDSQRDRRKQSKGESYAKQCEQ